MFNPERSKGGGIHRRRVLAKERTQPLPTPEKPPEKESLEGRLSRIERALSLANSTKNELEPCQIAEMEIEAIWLRARMEGMKDAERQSLLQRKLNFWEEKDPTVYRYLITINGSGLTPLAKIRDSVIPPRIISGFYTKR